MSVKFRLSQVDVSYSIEVIAEETYHDDYGNLRKNPKRWILNATATIDHVGYRGPASSQAVIEAAIAVAYPETHRFWWHGVLQGLLYDALCLTDESEEWPGQFQSWIRDRVSEAPSRPAGDSPPQ